MELPSPREGILKIAKLFKETLTLILAGGQGERLFPLTRDRAKPAVPFGGHYRIIASWPSKKNPNIPSPSPADPTSPGLTWVCTCSKLPLLSSGFPGAPTGAPPMTLAETSSLVSFTTTVFSPTHSVMISRITGATSGPWIPITRLAWI